MSCIPDATLDEWWDNCDFTRPEEDVQRLIAAYRESQDETARHRAHVAQAEGRLTAAYAENERLRAGLAKIMRDPASPPTAATVKFAISDLLSTSTDQPEGEPACGNPDCTMHHHGEA